MAEILFLLEFSAATFSLKELRTPRDLRYFALTLTVYGSSVISSQFGVAFYELRCGMQALNFCEKSFAVKSKDTFEPIPWT